MADREPVLLVVLIQSKLLSWHVGAINTGGQAIPLLRSELGNLDEYQELEFDEQLSFLRHRIAGVLQRGCDRLYAKHAKAIHFVLIADGHYLGAEEGITPRLAEHFVEWMISPPVTYFLQRADIAPRSDPSESCLPRSLGEIEIVAGEMPETIAEMLRKGLPSLTDQIQHADAWELVVNRSKPMA